MYYNIANVLLNFFSSVGCVGGARAILCKLAQMRALWGPLTSHLPRLTIVHYFHSNHNHKLDENYFNNFWI